MKFLEKTQQIKDLEVAEHFKKEEDTKQLELKKQQKVEDERQKNLKGIIDNIDEKIAKMKFLLSKIKNIEEKKHDALGAAKLENKNVAAPVKKIEDGLKETELQEFFNDKNIKSVDDVLNLEDFSEVEEVQEIKKFKELRREKFHSASEKMDEGKKEKKKAMEILSDEMNTDGIKPSYKNIKDFLKTSIDDLEIERQVLYNQTVEGQTEKEEEINNTVKKNYSKEYGAGCYLLDDFLTDRFCSVDIKSFQDAASFGDNFVKESLLRAWENILDQEMKSKAKIDEDKRNRGRGKEEIQRQQDAWAKAGEQTMEQLKKKLEKDWTHQELANYVIQHPEIQQILDNKHNLDNCATIVNQLHEALLKEKKQMEDKDIDASDLTIKISCLYNIFNIKQVGYDKVCREICDEKEACDKDLEQNHQKMYKIEERIAIKSKEDLGIFRRKEKKIEQELQELKGKKIKIEQEIKELEARRNNIEERRARNLQCKQAVVRLFEVINHSSFSKMRREFLITEDEPITVNEFLEKIFAYLQKVQENKLQGEGARIYKEYIKFWESAEEARKKLDYEKGYNVVIFPDDRRFSNK